MNEYEDYQTTATQEPVSDLFRDLRDESINLVRQQIELAKEETTEKVSKLLRNSAYLAAGGLVAYAGIIYLLLGINYLLVDAFEGAGLARDTSLWLSPIILGAVVGLVGFILVRKAIDTFKHTSVVPEKAINSLKEDRQWLAGKRP